MGSGWLRIGADGGLFYIYSEEPEESEGSGATELVS
jgi:hypothetical protein